MEAIVLAGGFGTRLRPLTYTRPKSLLPLLNKPMILHLVEMLPQEVDTLVLAVNYRMKQIEDFFHDSNVGLDIIINNEPEPLGTGGATKFAEEHITGTFITMNSDVVTDLALEDILAFHRQKGANGTISLWPVENVHEFGVVSLDDNGRIDEFVEKPKPEDAPSNLINAGAYIMERHVLDMIPPGCFVSLEQEIFPKIIKTPQGFYGFNHGNYWVDVGRLSSYIDASVKLLETEGLTKLLGQNCSLEGDMFKSTAGDDAEIGFGSQIVRSILYDGVIIGKNCKVSNSIIGEGAIVGDSAILQDVIVGDGEEIQPLAELSNERVWTQEIPEGYPNKQIGNVVNK